MDTEVVTDGSDALSLGGVLVDLALVVSTVRTVDLTPQVVDVANHGAALAVDQRVDHPMQPGCVGVATVPLAGLAAVALIEFHAVPRYVLGKDKDVRERRQIAFPELSVLLKFLL